MALWQFTVHLVPRSAAQSVFGHIPTRLSMDRFNTVEWFQLCPIRPDYRMVFDELLPRNESWSTNLEVWGDDEGDNISVFSVAGIPCEVSIRFDVRQMDIRFLGKVIATAKHLDCLVFTEAGALFDPSLEKLVAQINESEAKSFLKDPQQFLRTLPKE
jgi:hypothetical protein